MRPSPHPPGGDQVPVTESATESKKRVLVVDDERLNVDVLVSLLRDDYRMMVAKNGEQALKAARSDVAPDLILLDIMMPEMDGYEVCRQLKADPRTRGIPIIFVSAMGQEIDETRGLDLGAVDYITKPVSPAIVAARVRTHLAARDYVRQLEHANEVIEAQRGRMQEELDLARRMQLGMMPPAPVGLTGVELRAGLWPAREIGGDFYDFFLLADGRLCFCVGDVAGKGVQSALFMAATRALIRSQATTQSSPGRILRHVSAEVAKGNESCTFVTIWLGILDRRTGSVLFSNAGHNPPWLCKKDGTRSLVPGRHGPVAGALDDFAYKESTLELEDGDLLFLYTDGVTEAIDANGDLYSTARLGRLLEGATEADAETLVARVFDDVARHEDECPQSDDITLLALRFQGTRRWQLTLDNTLPEIERTREAFCGFATKAGIPGPVSHAFQVALDELLNNVISYGYEDEGLHQIRIDATLDLETLGLVIEDDARAFDPLSLSVPATGQQMEDRSVGGLGVHLVRKMMDEVDYTREGERNRLRLVKRWGAKPG
jgi:phosphoserine phosphatase RsbU/P